MRLLAIARPGIWFAKEPERAGCDNFKDLSKPFVVFEFAKEPERAGCDNSNNLYALTSILYSLQKNPKEQGVTTQHLSTSCAEAVMVCKRTRKSRV